MLCWGRCGLYLCPSISSLAPRHSCAWATLSPCVVSPPHQGSGCDPAGLLQHVRLLGHGPGGSVKLCMANPWALASLQPHANHAHHHKV